VPFAVLLGVTGLFFFSARGDASDTVKWSCYRNDKFTVLAIDKTDGVGAKFFAARAPAPSRRIARSKRGRPTSH
jgi:hypothetical protein